MTLPNFIHKTRRADALVGPVMPKRRCSATMPGASFARLPGRGFRAYVIPKRLRIFMPIVKTES